MITHAPYFQKSLAEMQAIQPWDLIIARKILFLSNFCKELFLMFCLSIYRVAGNILFKSMLTEIDKNPSRT